MQKNVFKNIISGIGGQLIILILGIVFPRIILTHYGSDSNGLLGTVTNIFTYMALLEAGIGQAARNAIYNPLTKGDRDKVNYLAALSQNYFRRVTVFYALGVVLLSFVLPLVLKSNIDYWTIFGVVFLQGAGGVASFYFIQTQMIILGADGKAYINNGINVIHTSLSYMVRIVLAVLGFNLVFLQLVYFVLSVFRVALYRWYFSRKYDWIKKVPVADEDKLQDRNSFIITEIAWTIFSSTDSIILSIFLGTQVSSVYLVYGMVFTGINTVTNAVYTSLVYMLGKTYHKDIKAYEKYHDAFNSVFFGGMTVLMCVALILTVPFIKLYTAGITDVEYVYESLPLLFCLVQLLSWSRYVSGNLTGIAGYAKPTSRISIIEASINILLSVILVNIIGITGVLIATVAALPLKAIYCNYVSDYKVMKRSCVNSIRILGLNFLLFGIAIIANNMLNIDIKSYLGFCVWGLVLTAIFGVLGIVVNLIANPQLPAMINNIRKSR
ncbi:MAG: hypothetical protein MJ108_01265 [Saccharofermentans sp.]|nr:hypothetical protein [Saccharofermentans sp.]